jgi:hypothetical protein
MKSRTNFLSAPIDKSGTSIVYLTSHIGFIVMGFSTFYSHLYLTYNLSRRNLRHFIYIGGTYPIPL